VNTANEDQARLWNGSAGSAWVDAQETLDRMFQPFEDLLVQASASATRVLDVGCGTGATTIAIARSPASASGAPGARCTGIDLSAPMIEVARRRAQQQGVRADFIVGDAQVHGFAPATYDFVVSRFGVMFFDDPVKAFGNLRRAAVPDASLLCQVFRSAAENPFMTAAERAAAPLLPALPPRRAEGPCQFAFADARKVQGIIESAGWRHVDLRPIDVHCTMPASDLDRYLMRLGPVGLALRDADEATRVRVVRAVRAAFEPYLHADEVRLTAACWEISARA
jgi:ubiquinone/menaquinone biosynthesis C-methylase UbiE